MRAELVAPGMTGSPGVPPGPPEGSPPWVGTLQRLGWATQRPCGISMCPNGALRECWGDGKVFPGVGDGGTATERLEQRGEPVPRPTRVCSRLPETPAPLPLLAA